MKFASFIAVALVSLFGAATAHAETNYASGQLTPCVSKEKAKDFATGPDSGLSAWGAEVAGGFDRQKAMDDFKKMQESHEKLLGDMTPVAVATCALNLGTDLFYSIRLPAGSRDDADKLCAKLKDGGVPCIVRKN
ncbi:SPOR domain-containing protein [Methyloligella solikamskensis]|uniref:SPOR domain-containing protein n=1 Tax=Methyloligella solikamskensis TaxID=1177756 RepID=A0ABW3J8C4_9HYPH